MIEEAREHQTGEAREQQTGEAREQQTGEAREQQPVEAVQEDTAFEPDRRQEEKPSEPHTEEQHQLERQEEAHQEQGRLREEPQEEQREREGAVAQDQGRLREVLPEATYEAGSLKAQLRLREHSIKIMICEKGESLEDLVGKREEPVRVVITRSNMPPALKRHFKTHTNLYEHIYHNLPHKDKVIITRDEIKLVLPPDGDKPRAARINLREFREKRERFEPSATLDNLEEWLLQFSKQDIDYVDDYFQKEKEKEKSEALSEDEEDLLEKWCEGAQYDSMPTREEIEQLQRELRGVDDFEKQIPQYKKLLPCYTSEQHQQRPQQQDRATTQSVATKDSVFPPGYVPPHLAKQTAPDGLTSDQHLRFQANQSKKEKLKLAKQLLKMGFSTSEVIQKLEAQERASKTGGAYVDPNPTPSQKPAKSTAPSVQSKSPSDKNSTAVRQMLLTLIKAKTYKKLDDVARHMANEGLQTSVEELKVIIDEIKAKNAQRKAQQPKD